MASAYFVKLFFALHVIDVYDYELYLFLRLAIEVYFYPPL
jgi:hypothetical protein